MARDTGEQLMTTYQRTHAVGTRVVDPKEDEHAQREQCIECHKALAGGVECQHVEQREGQCDIELRQHGIGPVLYGVGLLQIELGHQEVDDGHQIRDEHHRFGDACIHIAAIVCHGKEEVDSRHSRDEAVDVDVFTRIDQSGKLPNRQTRDDAKQQHHGLWAQKTGDNGCHENDACDCSDNKVFHIDD